MGGSDDHLVLLDGRYAVVVQLFISHDVLVVTQGFEPVDGVRVGVELP